MYLQPKFALATGERVGAEALVRWMLPDGRMISPQMFIPIFERNGFIADLDFYVYEIVCERLSQWQKLKQDIKPLSVNLSRVHMNNSFFPKKLKRLADQYIVDPSLLELELTESVFLDCNDHLLQVILELKAYGFTFSDRKRVV